MTATESPVTLGHYHIWTIGCQMNKADSERLESALVQLGLKPASTPKEADVIVLNSCVVRQSTEDRVVGVTSSLKPLKQRNPDRIVATRPSDRAALARGFGVSPKVKAFRGRVDGTEAVALKGLMKGNGYSGR